MYTGPKNSYNKTLTATNNEELNTMTTDLLQTYKDGYHEGRADLLEFVSIATGLKFETVADLVIYLNGVK